MSDVRPMTDEEARMMRVIIDLRAQIQLLSDKALRFDLDAAGIELREKEAAELIELRAENERLRRRLSEIDAALYLASEDVLWFHSKEDEGADLERWLVGVINCNDAFYYATADGEAIAPGEFLLARDVYDTYGYHGLIALAALRRKKEPLEPLRTPEYYAALKSLETDAAVEGER